MARLKLPVKEDWQDIEARANLEASGVSFDPNQRKVYITGNEKMPVEDYISTNPVVAQSRQPEISEPSFSYKVDQIINSLTGANNANRYQLWPEKLVRDALDAPNAAMTGRMPMWQVVDGELHTSPEAVKAGLDVSALAGTGGLGGVTEGTLGATPFLRPALKYKDKIYKAPAGGQHLDALPAELAPEFQRMAMSGEDISHYNFGFMNHKGHFLDREAALKYAIDEGLMSPHDAKFGALTSTMFADSSKPAVALKAAEPFFSQVEKTVANISQNKMTGEQWLGSIANKPGVKPEELDWTGLKSFLENKKGETVLKSDVEKHLSENAVKVGEVWKTDKRTSATGETIFEAQERVAREQFDKPYTNLSPDQRSSVDDLLKSVQHTKYHSYQLPGGENYRELLMTMPEKPSGYKKQYQLLDKNGFLQNQSTDPATAARWRANMRDNVGQIIEHEIPDYSGSYKSSHWDEPNILTHVRMNDRDIGGKKSLHLEEIQSDWHQQGRDKGYASDIKMPDRSLLEKQMSEIRDKAPANLDTMSKMEWLEKQPEYIRLRNEFNSQTPRNLADAVPDAPFKKNWHELALKRSIREAAEKGYDRLSWTPGEAQAARYDLSKQVDKINLIPDPSGKFRIDAFKNNNKVVEHFAKDESEIASVVGKEAAKKLLETRNQHGASTLAGQDLKIGGEGMKGFYDQIIPKAVEKLTGQKVKSERINKPEIVVAPEKLADGRIAYDVRVNGNLYSSFHTKAEAEMIAAKAEKEKMGTSVHYIEITPELRKKAMAGFPLFSDTSAPAWIVKNGELTKEE